MNTYKIYTVSVVYEWNIYGDELKSLIVNNKLKWNKEKIKNLSCEDLRNEYEKYKVLDVVDIDESMVGLSGIYENQSKDILIKLIKTNDDDNNILIIYKGVEGKFYIELMKKLKDYGCLIIKIIDNEVVFKDRVNIKLINALNNIEDEKKIRKKNFIEKTNIIGGFGDKFKDEWIKCIEIGLMV